MDEETLKLKGALMAQGALLAHVWTVLGVMRDDSELARKFHDLAVGTIERTLEAQLAEMRPGAPEYNAVATLQAAAIGEVDRILGVAHKLLQDRPEDLR